MKSSAKPSMRAVVAETASAVSSRPKCSTRLRAVVHDNTLNQYVVRMRRKRRVVAPDAAIVTVRGVGYRLG